MKKFVAILILCLTFVFCSVGFSACSLLNNKSSSEISNDANKIEEELTKDLPVTEDKYFDFTLLEDDTYSIKAKNGYEMPETVVLPAEHNGKKITVIEKEGFKDSRGLKSIILSDNITIIDDKAFENSDELMYVTIPDSVKSIGYSAFEDCDALTAVIIGDGVTSIGKYAFEYCTSLISVTIGSNVNDIGSEAFHDCDKLIEICNKSSLNIIAGAKDNGYVGYYAKNVYTPTSGASKLFTDEKGFILYDKTVLVGYVGNEINVVLPEGVTEIYTRAFQQNKSLTSITLPSSLTIIQKYAFSCYRLVEICNKSSLTITAGSYDNGGIGAYAKNIYKSGTSKLKTDKNGYVIYDNKSLIGYTGTETELTLPSGITEINQYALYDCTSLIKVTIPNSVTNIGERAFYNCYWLESIVIPDNVTNIGNGAFYSCEKLIKLTIGAKVASIGDKAFYGCSSLIEVYNKSSMVLKPITESGYYFYNSSNITDGYIGYYAKNIYTPTSGASKLTTDDKGFTLFDNKTLVTYTGNQTDLTLPNGITNIHALAFAGNRLLKSITIPESVIEIEDCALAKCGALTSISLPDSIKKIGNDVFGYCNLLTNINYNGTMEQWNNISKASYWNNYSVIKTIICTDGTIDL